MRHTESGLAIPDFPKMGGAWIPLFNTQMLAVINDWRFENNYDPVTQIQIIYHFCHRLGALIIAIIFCLLNYVGIRHCSNNKNIRSTLIWIDFFVILQIYLGITTVLTQKAPHVTSLHVATGAIILGLSVLLFLRVSPLSFKNFKQQVCQS